MKTLGKVATVVVGAGLIAAPKANAQLERSVFANKDDSASASRLVLSTANVTTDSSAKPATYSVVGFGQKFDLGAGIKTKTDVKFSTGTEGKMGSKGISGTTLTQVDQEISLDIQDLKIGVTAHGAYNPLDPVSRMSGGFGAKAEGEVEGGKMFGNASLDLQKEVGGVKKRINAFAGYCYADTLDFMTKFPVRAGLAWLYNNNGENTSGNLVPVNEIVGIVGISGNVTKKIKLGVNAIVGQYTSVIDVEVKTGRLTFGFETKTLNGSLGVTNIKLSETGAHFRFDL